MSESLTTREVADAIGVSPATVQGYARAGRIPFRTTPGGHRRYDLVAVVSALGAGASLSRGAVSVATGAGEAVEYPTVLSPSSRSRRAVARVVKVRRSATTLGLPGSEWAALATLPDA